MSSRFRLDLVPGGVPSGVSPGPLECWEAKLRLSDYQRYAEQIAKWSCTWFREVWTDRACWENSGGAQRIYGPWPALPDPDRAVYPGWEVPVVEPIECSAAFYSLEYDGSPPRSMPLRRFRLDLVPDRELRRYVRVWVEHG